MVEVKKKVCLIVIDGWGISENKEGNKILFLKKTTLFVVGVHCSSEPLPVRLFYMYVKMSSFTGILLHIYCYFDRDNVLRESYFCHL